MKVSIITVCYNSEKTIRDAIESVVAQTYPDIEYLVIDGLSKDQTLPIVKSYSERISKLISEPDKGIYDAMNKGISLATGEIIGILNSDDFYATPQVIEEVVKQFSSAIDGVYGDLVYVSPDDTGKIVRTWKSGTYQEGAFRKGWMPPHPAFFVRKSCYEKFGHFTDKLKSAADYEFMLRLIHKNKIRITYLPQVLVKMRAGGASNASLKNRLKANKEDRLAWKLNGLKPAPFLFLRKPLSKLGQFFNW